MLVRAQGGKRGEEKGGQNFAILVRVIKMSLLLVESIMYVLPMERYRCMPVCREGRGRRIGPFSLSGI
jgi:hypothetical protein